MKATDYSLARKKVFENWLRGSGAIQFMESAEIDDDFYVRKQQFLSSFHESLFCFKE